MSSRKHDKSKPAKPDDDAVQESAVINDELLTDLGTEARIMRGGAIPLGDGITDEQRAEIIAAVNHYRETHGITIKSIALGTGIAQSTINEVLNDKYKADAEKPLRRLNAWLSDDAARRGGSAPIGFYATSIFKRIQRLAADAKRNAVTSQRTGDLVAHDPQRIGIVYGASGCGKSLAARVIAEDDPRAILIRIVPGEGRATYLAQQILRALNREPRRGIGHVSHCISELLFSGRLIIIDEAQSLQPNALDVVRALADVAGVPVILLATHDVQNKLTDARLLRRHLAMDQFASRLLPELDLHVGESGGSDGGGTRQPIFTLDDIRKIFRADQIRIAPEAWEWLQALACTPGLGMLRRALAVFNAAQRLRSVVESGAITSDSFRKAFHLSSRRGADVTDLLARVDSMVTINAAKTQRGNRRRAATG